MLAKFQEREKEITKTFLTYSKYPTEIVKIIVTDYLIELEKADYLITLHFQYRENVKLNIKEYKKIKERLNNLPAIKFSVAWYHAVKTVPWPRPCSESDFNSKINFALHWLEEQRKKKSDIQKRLREHTFEKTLNYLEGYQRALERNTEDKNGIIQIVNNLYNCVDEKKF